MFGLSLRDRKLFMLVFSFSVCAFVLFYQSGVIHRPAGKSAHLAAATWNIAAINNNPFEYWITYDDPAYDKLMAKVSRFIQEPGAHDVPVHEVFTEQMFAELQKEMLELGWDDKYRTAADLGGVSETVRLWNEEYKDRKIISGFIKDGLLGKKRLASMPDRVSNTINVEGGGTAMRPTVINCFEGELSTTSQWWAAWRQFVFEREIAVKDKQGQVVTRKVAALFAPIKKSKYPAITEAEEQISVPLQTLAVAIFDAILVRMMNTLAKEKWQGLRSTMCERLNRRKVARVVEILSTEYREEDIVFLQEVASAFIPHAEESTLSLHFHIHAPQQMDRGRDQNSLILLRKGLFQDMEEVTSAVIATGVDLVPGFNVETGDLFCLRATFIGEHKHMSLDTRRLLLCSFHGDTDGVATLPVVEAVQRYAKSQAAGEALLFGLDANVYEHPAKGQQSHAAFVADYTSKGLSSCYGDGDAPSASNYTTFHARTYLQPQLNKAVTAEERDVKGDKNPKDAILFWKADFEVLATSKDNTGQRRFQEGMVFPTLDFPSDHGITSTALNVKVR